MLKKISDLDERLDAGNFIEWQSPLGTRYRYDRRTLSVGVEDGGFGVWSWFALGVQDKRAAKRVVFDAINADEA